jgi:uncharacterized protein (UPF0332 family)
VREGKVATWEELSRDCLQAAKRLAEVGHFRSSISRAYYAAYCAIAGASVARGVSFAHGWNNPAHDQLTGIVASHLSLRRWTRRRMVSRTRLLRRAREDADYRPRAFSGPEVARDCLQIASWILTTLEPGHD